MKKTILRKYKEKCFIVHKSKYDFLQLAEKEILNSFVFENEDQLMEALIYAEKNIEIVYIVTPLKIHSSRIFNQLNKMELNLTRIVYIYFPFQDIKKDKLNVYKKFLTNDTKKITFFNNQLIRLFNPQSELIIEFSSKYNLNLKISNKFYSENGCISENELVTQIPGGEIYTALELGSANGVICIDEDGECTVLEVKNNFCMIDGKRRIISEFGIGTNSDIPDIAYLDCYEKRRGTIHLGFGDNRSLGGTIKADYHFDVVFTNFCIRDYEGRLIYEKGTL